MTWARLDVEGVQQLLTDWIDAEASLITEHSGSMAADTRQLVTKAALRARRIGLTFTPDLIPPHVADICAEEGDEL